MAEVPEDMAVVVGKAAAVAVAVAAELAVTTAVAGAMRGNRVVLVEAQATAVAGVMGGWPVGVSGSHLGRGGAGKLVRGRRLAGHPRWRSHMAPGGQLRANSKRNRE